ncbi:MAG: hypothetical protein IPL50_19950 [Chitinophagaceae bacterium]|nr:hypothetical protein [Chitinophagaceae bacterium]
MPALAGFLYPVIQIIQHRDRICKAQVKAISLRHCKQAGKHIMQEQIASYLFQNKTCPLPGLGTLSVVKSGAEANFAGKQITAPKPVIRLENKESDTTGLVKYIANVSGDDTGKASEALDHFCIDLKKQMKLQSTVKLARIGNFFADGSGKISFKPEELPASFVQPVYAERVIHPDAEHQILVGDKETTNTVMTEFFTEVPAVKDRWWIWAIVLGVIGLLLVVIYFTQLNGTPAFGNAVKI